MRIKTSLRHFVQSATLCLAFLAAVPAMAGLPEPGIILYGQVLGEDGSLITTGRLTWTYSPAEGGDPVSVTVDLRRIDGAGGPYSYRALIPLETSTTLFPVNNGAIEVFDVVTQYVRTGTVAGSEITMTHNVALSTADIGTARRVDLCLDCNEETLTSHTADIDGDFFFSASEAGRVLDLYLATPTHEYHTDAQTVDGFAAGAGPRERSPHSSDFINGVDWRFSFSELLRMIDLYDSTPDGAYGLNSGSEDGFDKYWSGGAPDGLTKSLADSARLSVKRRAHGGAATSTEPILTIDIEIQTPPEMPLSALGVEEVLPPGWIFVGVAGPDAPSVAPYIGETGKIAFVWFPTPGGTLRFSYDVLLPASGNAARAYYQLYGRAGYRVATSGNEKSAGIYGEGHRPPVDTNGDGIPELVLAYWDTDGDGVADFGQTIYVDSDNNGTPDFVIFTTDTDGDGRPDHLESNADSDLDGIPDFLDTDSDNDEMSDADENTFGTNPLDPLDYTSMPAVQGYWLVLCAVLLGLAASRRLRHFAVSRKD